jgi:hypothetical protein
MSASRRLKLEDHSLETRLLLVKTRDLWDDYRRITRDQQALMNQVRVNLARLRIAGVSIGILCRELAVDPHSLYKPSMRDFVMSGSGSQQ